MKNDEITGKTKNRKGHFELGDDSLRENRGRWSHAGIPVFATFKRRFEIGQSKLCPIVRLTLAKLILRL